jgi:PII-like signaling protein
MYNKRNKMLMYQRIIEIVNKHYIEGVTTYAGVFREYVYDKYPMTYENFMRIINMPHIGSIIEKEKETKDDAGRISEPFKQD